MFGETKFCVFSFSHKQSFLFFFLSQTFLFFLYFFCKKMSVFLCGVCAARVRGSSLAEFGEFGDSRADLPQFDSGVALCLGALTPRDCCMLCLNLFPFLQSSAAVELLRFAVSPFSQRRFVLSVALSASHMLRETLLCRQRTTSPSASEWAARFVRELLVGDNWTEGEGGVVVTLSDSNGPNDVLAVQDASAPAPQTNSGDKSSKRQKRARAANEQPQQLSRARLQQLLAHSSPAQLVSDILRRTQNQICPPLAAHPTFTAVHKKKRKKENQFFCNFCFSFFRIKIFVFFVSCLYQIMFSCLKKPLFFSQFCWILFVFVPFSFVLFNSLFCFSSFLIFNSCV